MINLHDIENWTRLEDGEIFDFPGNKARSIKMEVNTSDRTILMIQVNDQEPRFLALVDGRETLTFVVSGSFSIMHKAPIGTEVYFRTADGDSIHRVSLDAQAFTRLHERRAVNPEFEYMRYQMEANFQKRMDAQRAQIERMLADAAAAAPAPVSGTESTGTTDPVETGGDTGSEPPAPQPVGDGSETGGGV